MRIHNAVSPEFEILELNRQLTGIANEQALGSWWIPTGARSQPIEREVDRFKQPASSARRFFLQLDSPIEDAPGMSGELLRRMKAAGIFRVADLLRSAPSKLGAMIRVEPGMLEHHQRVAELMCGTPQLRAFDAQVLVGCGISRSDALRSLPTSELVQRVETFLASATGQDLLRGDPPSAWLRDKGTGSQRRIAGGGRSTSPSIGL